MKHLLVSHQSVVLVGKVLGESWPTHCVR